jgi:hypothetical protein
MRDKDEEREREGEFLGYIAIKTFEQSRIVLVRMRKSNGSVERSDLRCNQ